MEDQDHHSHLVTRPSLAVLLRELLRVLHELLPVARELLREVSAQRVFRLWFTNQRHERLYHCAVRVSGLRPASLPYQWQPRYDFRQRRRG